MYTLFSWLRKYNLTIILGLKVLFTLYELIKASLCIHYTGLESIRANMECTQYLATEQTANKPLYTQCWVEKLLLGMLFRITKWQPLYGVRAARIYRKTNNTAGTTADTHCCHNSNAGSLFNVRIPFSIFLKTQVDFHW